MRRWWVAAAMALVGALSGCGNDTKQGAAEGQGPPGQMRVALNGDPGGMLAYIVVRNVFDTSLSWVVECNKKDHTVNGEAFCDELIVVPPGVYEIVIQSQDQDCRSEQDHYKVIVQPNETTEIRIPLICGSANGGLDTVVRVSELPVVQDIDFNFAGTGAEANKFICRTGEPVEVSVTVTDSDTACADLQEQWLENGVAYTGTPLELIESTSRTELPPLEPGGYPRCVFTALLNPLAPDADYALTLEVSDGANNASFTFPIHLIVGDANCCTTIHNGNSTYYVCPTGMPWVDAEADCVSRGAHLATINDGAENTFVQGLAVDVAGTGYGAWIGYNDRAAEGSFVWASGQSPGFTDWMAGEPNNGGVPGGNEDCTSPIQWISTILHWNDMPCEWALPYICEKN